MHAHACSHKLLLTEALFKRTNTAYHPQVYHIIIIIIILLIIILHHMNDFTFTFTYN